MLDLISTKAGRAQGRSFTRSTWHVSKTVELLQSGEDLANQRKSLYNYSLDQNVTVLILVYLRVSRTRSREVIKCIDENTSVICYLPYLLESDG